MCVAYELLTAPKTAFAVVVRKVGHNSWMMLRYVLLRLRGPQGGFRACKLLAQATVYVVLCWVVAGEKRLLSSFTG